MQPRFVLLAVTKCTIRSSLVLCNLHLHDFKLKPYLSLPLAEFLSLRFIFCCVLACEQVVAGELIRLAGEGRDIHFRGARYIPPGARIPMQAIGTPLHDYLKKPPGKDKGGAGMVV